ncbi:hypothetical protein [Kitasatospora viridis]|uniref:hypothetical protein n=1 Tax=Kitasatospora viridis TaxID=281105 RepID=UPI0011A21321|nr:hypothetical protein [Kitasatospora viridis]
MPTPIPVPAPTPDPRARDLARDFADMAELVGPLVLPDGASRSVLSALETARELVRHSYYRYEFATVAVTHGLLGLEQALRERLGGDGTPQELIARAVGAELFGAGLGAELDRAHRLRERIALGEVTSGALTPSAAVGILRTVYAAVGALTGPVAVPPPQEQLTRLWQEHRRAPFPASFLGVDLAGVELVLLDADLTGLVQRELDGGLDDDGLDALWECLAGADRILPLINEEYCARYFTRLRTVARLAAARHIPSAI